MTRSYQIGRRILVLIASLLLYVERQNAGLGPCHGLASPSSFKKNRSNGGGGGFGASSSGKGRSLVLEPDNSPEIIRLMEYLKSQKADVDHVAVGWHPQHGRGLYTTKTFSKSEGGQILCRVPSDCALALADPEQQQAKPLSLAEEGANMLQLYLHNPERRAQFAAYLDTLPQKVTDPTPNLFDFNDELPLLEFPRIIQKSQERHDDILRVAKERGLSLAELQYATWLVSSRSFPLAVSPDGETVVAMDDRGQVLTQADRQRQSIRVLVPLLDMVNHADSAAQPPQSKVTLQPQGAAAPASNARWIIMDPQKDNAWFALQSTRPIPAGSEIRVAYGSGIESTMDILLNYGFVPTVNGTPTPHFVDALMLQKGGEGCFSSLDDWSTTLEEDEALLQLMKQQAKQHEGEQFSFASNTLAKIIAFRIRLKKAYSIDVPRKS
ncbi:hypothetical protein ACA910_016124 [Epithemia clementina (nom. ined.)]